MALRFPSKLRIARIQCIREQALGGQDSIFTLKQKRFDYGSSRWRWIVTTTTIAKTDAEAITAFFGRIKNETVLWGHPNYRSYDFDWVGRTSRNHTQTGNPVMQSGVATGEYLNVRGLLDLQNLLQGTYFHILGEDGRQYLYQIAESEVAHYTTGDLDATATLRVFPAVRGAIGAGQWLRFHDVLGEHYLTSPPTFTYSSDGHLQPFTFELTSI